MLKSIDTLRLLSVIFFALGAYEIIVDLYTSWAQGGFSGDGFLLFTLGIAIRRRNAWAYNLTLYATYAFCFLVVAAIISTVWMIFQIESSTSLPLKSDYPGTEILALLPLATTLPLLLYLLHHPDTRNALYLDTFRAGPRSLYVPPLRAFLLFLISSAFCVLVAGPHFAKNPYKSMTISLVHDPGLAEEVGLITRLHLLDTHISNRNAWARWRITGERSEAVYEVTLDSKGKTSIDPAPEV